LAQGFVASMLAACGFAQGGPNDQRIRIPEHIAKSPLSVVRAFVAGLLDSDGTVADDGSPSYTTASAEMAHDLAALLSLLGYRPTLHRKEPSGRGKVATYTVLLCPLPQVSELAGDVAGFMSSEFRKNRLHSDCRGETALTLPFAVWRDELAELGLVHGRGTKGAGPLADELDRWSCNAAGRIRRDDLQAVARALEPLDRSAAELLGSVARRGQEIESVARAPQALPYYDLTVEGWNTYASGRTGLALIHNTGFAFSDLRHQGAEVHSTGKDASGPVSFMKVFNAATDSIKQGGVRRGANMGVLRVDHPDVFHFMSCKKELDAENRALWNRFSDTGRYTEVELAHLKQELLQTQINNFNISVGVTDEFMRAVRDGSDFSLLDPRTKAVVKTVPAREIWDAIVEGAWQNGEPGVLFLDHPEVNPLPGLGPIAATNPCVTADTWVFTSQGARRVRELVGVPFEAVVDGRAYPSSPGGFFFTGNKAVFRVKTSRGYELDATADHPLLVDRDGTRVWTKVGELAVGDTLVLHDHADAAWKGSGSFAQGRLLGTLLGDGQLHVEGADAFRFRTGTAALTDDSSGARARRAMGGADAQRAVVAATTRSNAAAELAELAHAYGMVREALQVTDEIESASSDFIRGFLQSWFDADGSVQGDLHDGGSVRLVASSDADLAIAQRMLARLGVVSTLFRERSAGPGRIYHKLVISRRDMVRFAKRVGFGDGPKQRRLLAIIDTRAAGFEDRHRTDVVAIEPLGVSPVFDCTIPGVHAFDANGLYAHNCGEQFLHGYDSCNLGSINVGHFYDAGTKDVDWDRLAQTTAVALRFLDNVIDANIYPIDEIREMVTNNRRVGLGIMGFADLLIQLQIAYGSPEAVAFAGKLMAFIQARAQDTSETLARERGDFPNKHLSIWAGDSRPRRNAALLSIAPTGTISMIAGCSFGCEPYFGMAYTKHVMKDSEGRPQHLYYIVPLFEEISKDEGFFSEELLGRIEENRGSLKGIAGVPQHWQDVFTVAADVTVEQHIDMLAAFQKSTDNAVSKTINAPNNDSRENVSRAIFRAYEAGCKGFTYYRDGSRTEQVVTFSKDGDLAGGNRDVAPAADPKPALAQAAAAAEHTTATDEPDIDALLAKANALLEVR
jgi:ribonucleoside-diphosphate reductase alpha chain